MSFLGGKAEKRWGAKKMRSFSYRTREASFEVRPPSFGGVFFVFFSLGVVFVAHTEMCDSVPQFVGECVPSATMGLRNQVMAGKPCLVCAAIDILEDVGVLVLLTCSCVVFFCCCCSAARVDSVQVRRHEAFFFFFYECPRSGCGVLPQTC